MWKKIDHAFRSALQSRFEGAPRQQAEALSQQLARIESKLNTIEHFPRGAEATYVGNNSVLVKCVVAGHRLGYLVEANDRLINPWFIVAGGYDTQLTDFFVRELRPNSRCIDVGSNFGYFTCLFARLAPSGQVSGIEADPNVFELAQR